MALRLVGLICAVVFFGKSTAVTSTEEAKARAECRAALDINDDFIAGFVRLSFHDCVGGCDGCFNSKNADNAGLERYASELQTAFEEGTAFNTMTRADFWALCGAEAVLRGHANAGNNDAAPRVTVRFGRQDCAGADDSPVYHDDSAINKFPSAITGLTPVLEFFQEEFGLTDEETVALLGAHSLGRGRRRNSGFRGPWVARETHLDNSYFVDMLDQRDRFRWTQRNAGTDQNPEWQYSHANGNSLMLNADICLITDIAPDSDGREDRDLTQIGDSSTREFVEDYANNNAAFLEDFGNVFTKMIHNGYTLTELNEATGVDNATITSQPAAPTTTGSPLPKKKGQGSNPRPRSEDREELIRILNRILADEQ